MTLLFSQGTCCYVAQNLGTKCNLVQRTEGPEWIVVICLHCTSGNKKVFLKHVAVTTGNESLQNIPFKAVFNNTLKSFLFDENYETRPYIISDR
jgi:hypothetical protein